MKIVFRNTNNIILVFCIVLICIQQSLQHGMHNGQHFDCVHDQKQEKANKQIEADMEERKILINKYLNGESVDEDHPAIQQFKRRQQRRKLVAYEEPTDLNTDYIRIKFDSSPLDALVPSVMSQEQKDFIQNQLDIAKSFYQRRLKVIPYPDTELIVTPSTCQDYSVPTEHRTSPGGGQNIDYLFYVTAENNQQNFLAWASYCQLENFDSGTDNNRPGRPMVAQLNYNVKFITDFTYQGVASFLETTLHEVAHALGFSGSYMKEMRKPDGSVWGTTVTKEVTIRGLDTFILVTPNVRAWAADHYGCEKINDDLEIDENFHGVQLENQGTAGSAGSHWERTIFYDEIMTASRLGPTKTFSGATWAFFKDTGHYIVDEIGTEKLQWGYKKGCDFYNLGCTDQDESYEEFCEFHGQTKCSGGREGKGGCDKQQYELLFMDAECGLVNTYSTTRCIYEEDAANDGAGVLNGAHYGLDSRCFESTLGTGTVECYQYSCSSDNALTVTIKNESVVCESEGQQHDNVGGGFGTLTCPNPEVFCGQGRNFCENWCSDNGYCTDGFCNCKYGYGGADCSKQDSDCTGGLLIDSSYWDESSSQCVTDTTCCNNNVIGCNKFPNELNRLCQVCSGTCSTCFTLGNDKCTSCSADQAFLLNEGSLTEGQCLASCPAQQYKDADDNNKCKPCQVNAGEDCEACGDQSETPGCTECQTDHYLDKFTDEWFCRASSDDCAVGSVKDHELKQCLTQCTGNKVEDNTDTCVLCSGDNFKNKITNQCTDTCPDGTYGDTTTRACEDCNDVCDTCTGSTSSDCIACSAGNYLYASRCVSECPENTFEDTNECTQCDSKCWLCSGGSDSECSECQHGYLLSGTTCVSECTDPGTYTDTSQRACSDCHESCETCSKGQDTQCLSCGIGKVFFKNYSVSQCLDECPQGYYTKADNTCGKCHFSCNSCNGSTLDDCVDCIETYSKYSFIEVGGQTKNQCRYKCPIGYFSHDIDEDPETVNDSACIQCHTNCKRCTGVEEYKCSKCFEPTQVQIDAQTDDTVLKYLNNGQCVVKCPASKPADKYTYQCEANHLEFYVYLILTTILLSYL